ncbi:MAG: family 43 glycosylhydrolase [Verrucomicrobiota bacterium]
MKPFLLFCLALSVSASQREIFAAEWTVTTQKDWKAATAESSNLKFKNGRATPTSDQATFSSSIKSFNQKIQPKSLTLRQIPDWNNWEAVPSVGPEDAKNAPVFLPVADGDYWYFGAKAGGPKGYHAWHSTDMKSWAHHGPVTQSNWMTTAEYADGKFYLYYDQPNDEDPHLILDDDVTDGEFSDNDRGMVFSDPSPGSDAGIFRDDDGTFHLIYEDWTPINAKENSWDSPLGGHASSPDGINGFEPHEHTPVIDERTEPTGEKGTYKHGPTGIREFEVHKPDQNAYGDYTLIKVGGQYYIFCDYDPHGEPMRVGQWTSDDINTEFTWAGDIGMGFHPDPTVGFAEGQFYLIVQRAQEDFISPGPWVDTVEARAGVDSDGDGTIDQWTDWQEVRESYSQKPGFARVVETTPATIDLSSLPEGQGFQFEFKVNDTTEGKAPPTIDQVILAFD